jgi:hypothetical protein
MTVLTDDNLKRLSHAELRAFVVNLQFLLRDLAERVIDELVKPTEDHDD